jgi:hypothetical protein
MRLPNKPPVSHLIRGASRSRLAGSVRHLDGVERDLLQVIRCRCAIFKRKFGRVPGPQEPLFFDDRYGTPVQAHPREVLSQIREASQAAEVGAERILSYLRL